jgi:hypothetical protein
MINDIITVTELSRLTGKTRPTVYKYVKDYEQARYDSVPYTFLMLLELMEDEKTTKRDIIEYCKKHYSDGEELSPLLSDVIELLKSNSDRIDLEKIKTIIIKEIKKNEK